MSDHNEREILSAYIDEELDANERSAVESHLSQCAVCAGEAAELRRVALAVAGSPGPRMPDALMAALEERYAPRRSWAARVGHFLALPRVWVPAGSLAAVALTAFLWLGSGVPKTEDTVPLETLLAAHARYTAESLAPKGNLVNSDFFRHLKDD